MLDTYENNPPCPIDKGYNTHKTYKEHTFDVSGNTMTVSYGGKKVIADQFEDTISDFIIIDNSVVFVVLVLCENGTVYHITFDTTPSYGEYNPMYHDCDIYGYYLSMEDRIAMSMERHIYPITKGDIISLEDDDFLFTEESLNEESFSEMMKTGTSNIVHLRTMDNRMIQVSCTESFFRPIELCEINSQ